MCKLLNISRSSLYYAKNKPTKKYNAEEEKLTQHIKEIFKNSRIITMDLEKSKLN
jgi:putative transposase